MPNALSAKPDKAAKKVDVAPRKTAQQERSRKKLEAIIETAFEMLGEMPSHKINTKLIAKRAGVSIGTLYQFFPNKDAIFYEMFRRWLEATLASLDRVEAELADDCKPEDCVDAFLAALTEPRLNSLQNWKLRYAMGSSEKLIELEANHRLEVFQRIYRLQEKLGNRPPANVEPQVMMLQNEVTLVCLYSMAFLEKAPNIEVIRSLIKKLLLVVYDYDTWLSLGDGEASG